MSNLVDVAGTGSVSFNVTGGGQISAEIHNAIYEPPPESPSIPPWTDRVADMPINEAPTHEQLVALGWTEWPTRQLGDIAGVTIHHTMSHSPVALAEYCTGPKGLPTLQYHIWISAGDGCPAWLCVPLDRALWHDHTGRHQRTISVGLAGRLHEQAPPDEQLESAARVCRWLIQEYGLGVEDVLGHKDRAPVGTTVCPGWEMAGWRPDFYRILRGM